MPALQIAIVYAQKGDDDRAFSWLERAYEQRDAGMIELKADPELEPLRNDIRFQSSAQKGGVSRLGNAASPSAGE